MGDRSLTRHRHVLPVKKCRPTLDLFQRSLNSQAERQASGLVSGACALLFGLLTLKTFHSAALLGPDSKNCPTKENRRMNGTPNAQGALPNTQDVISNTQDGTSGTPDSQDMTANTQGMTPNTQDVTFNTHDGTSNMHDGTPDAQDVTPNTQDMTPLTQNMT